MTNGDICTISVMNAKNGKEKHAWQKQKKMNKFVRNAQIKNRNEL